MRTADGYRFRSPDGRYAVALRDAPLRSMIGFAADAKGRAETGGVLLGRYEEANRVAVILEVTGPPGGSARGRTWFRRGTGDLDALLERRWQDGTYYLGEWHTHPNCSPVPSRDDLQAMSSISGSRGYACPEPILLILGGSPPTWQLSATVIANGNPVGMARVVEDE